MQILYIQYSTWPDIRSPDIRSPGVGKIQVPYIYIYREGVLFLPAL